MKLLYSLLLIAATLNFAEARVHSGNIPGSAPHSPFSEIESEISEKQFFKKNASETKASKRKRPIKTGKLTKRKKLKKAFNSFEKVKGTRLTWKERLALRLFYKDGKDGEPEDEEEELEPHHWSFYAAIIAMVTGLIPAAIGLWALVHSKKGRKGQAIAKTMMKVCIAITILYLILGFLGLILLIVLLSTALT